MNRKQHDDLFENSAMTFGEHLEELRGALARALVGLVVGFLIALPFADNAVRFVTRPLKRALSRVYLDQAKARLTGEEAKDLSPEEWSLLGEQQLIPSTVQLDLTQVINELSAGRSDEAETFSSLAAQPLQASIRTGDVAPIARSFTEGKAKWMNEPAKAVWSLLTDAEQKRMHELAALPRPGQADLDDLLEILQRLFISPTLASHESLSDLDDLFASEGPRKSVERLREQAAGNADRMRLNRLLVAAALEMPVLAPQPRVIDVRIWKPANVNIQSLNAQEPFLILIKAALILGLLLASPWVFFHLWNFVASGLYPTERKYVYTYLPFSLGLFFLGASMAFFFVFDPVLNFLFSFNTLMKIEAVPRISEWVSFVLFLPIGFGVSFQLPLVMLLLERIGVFTVESYLSRWRIAILIIFTISMFLTPSDPMSMLLMGLPLTFLYFVGILLCQRMPRTHSPVGAGYDP